MAPQDAADDHGGTGRLHIGNRGSDDADHPKQPAGQSLYAGIFRRCRFWCCAGDPVRLGLASGNVDRRAACGLRRHANRRRTGLSCCALSRRFVRDVGAGGQTGPR